MPEAKASDKLNVFISYSRDDLKFADQLDDALQATGFPTIIDRHDITGGEEWRVRLGGLIRDADSVVFVLSSASARSKVCAWEVDEAMRLNKRIIPVLCRALAGESPPPALAQRHYIFFYEEPKLPGSGFGQGLRQLVTALDNDFDWLREHTRLLQRATEWEVGGRSPNRLLSGSDIVAAKAWAAHRPKDAPEPTDVHLAFLRASEDEEAARANAERRRLEDMAAAQKERQKAIEERELAVRREADAQKARARAKRIIAWGVAAVVAVMIAAVSSFAVHERFNSEQQALLKEDAFRQKGEADRRKDEAEKQARLAAAKTEEAVRAQWEAERRQVNLLAELTASETLRGSLDTALRLGVHAARHALDGAGVSAPGAALAAALWQSDWRLILSGHEGPLNSAAFSPDGTRIVTASDDKTARIWDAATAKVITVLRGHEGPVNSAAFSPDGKRIVTASWVTTPRIWDAATAKEFAVLGGGGRRTPPPSAQRGSALSPRI
jgi:hypothetical protein